MAREGKGRDTDRVQITEEVKEPRNFPQEDLHLENIFLTVVMASRPLAGSCGNLGERVRACTKGEHRGIGSLLVLRWGKAVKMKK